MSGEFSFFFVSVFDRLDNVFWSLHLSVFTGDVFRVTIFWCVYLSMQVVVEGICSAGPKFESKWVLLPSWWSVSAPCSTSSLLVSPSEPWKKEARLASFYTYSYVYSRRTSSLLLQFRWRWWSSFSSWISLRTVMQRRLYLFAGRSHSCESRDGDLKVPLYLRHCYRISRGRLYFLFDSPDICYDCHSLPLLRKRLQARRFPNICHLSFHLLLVS